MGGYCIGENVCGRGGAHASLLDYYGGELPPVRQSEIKTMVLHLPAFKDMLYVGNHVIRGAVDYV
jgi:hypothetical protein